MTKKSILIFALIYVSFFSLVGLAGGLKKGTSDSAVSESPLSGGKTTVFNTSREAFAKPAANLPTEDLRQFTFGNKMFNTKWVTAPASVTSLDGLGPTFNRMSCAACHFKDGRGRPPKEGESEFKSMLVRLSVPGESQHGGPNPHPVYGDQLNENGINGVAGEGRAQILYTEVNGQYDDGMAYTLRKPAYEFMDMAFGDLGPDIMFSPRVAGGVYGSGLLEAIPEETILNWADADDGDADGISGRPNMVWDVIKQERSLGRFGWKANVPSLLQQDAGAANGDIGITTNLFPHQNCQPAQAACKEAPHGGDPEMSDEQLEKMTFYVRTLAVPARRDLDNPAVQRGAKLFEQAGCASCHKPQVRTGWHEIEALSFQDIQPFTDLLLHDMGPELADGRPDFEASGSEWRTPPLWGIGLVKTVNKHTNFLHDGRARNLEEAVLWHGGEAEQAKNQFKAMPVDDRTALLTFLNSL